MAGKSTIVLRKCLISLTRLSGKYVRRIQGVILYKKIRRLFSSRIEICEVRAGEKAQVKNFLRVKVDKGNKESPHVTDFVAWTNGRIAGFVQLVRFPKDNVYFGYWLVGLIVHVLYRRLGIGEGLSQAVIEKARAEGAEALSLIVFEDNREAVRLYRKLGFEVQAVPGLRNPFENVNALHDRKSIVMRKLLTEQP